MFEAIKTTFCTFLALMGAYGGDDIQDVFKYYPINETVSTSGLLKKNQLKGIQEAGFKNIINLLPDDSMGALENEKSLVENLGMRYIYIPVDGGNPTKDDFRKFVKSMQSISGEKIWIHCGANARVSVFLYKYRISVLNESVEKAKEDLLEIWEPLGVWNDFMLENIPITP
jgi:protein tyrosine phosphatase (PTP) superfamily phosphohydrolase (DUF442 family)